MWGGQAQLEISGKGGKKKKVYNVVQGEPHLLVVTLRNRDSGLSTDGEGCSHTDNSV